MGKYPALQGSSGPDSVDDYNWTAFSSLWLYLQLRKNIERENYSINH
jgi:hypothetical protein